MPLLQPIADLLVVFDTSLAEASESTVFNVVKSVLKPDPVHGGIVYDTVNGLMTLNLSTGATSASHGLVLAAGDVQSTLGAGTRPLLT